MATSETPTRISDSAHPVFAPIQKVLCQHPLVSFFILAYAFSWLLTIPFILWEWGLLPGDKNLYTLVFAIKAYAGPFFSAYIMTRALEGKAGWVRFRQSFRHWRVGWQWYAFLFLIFPAFILFGIAITPGALASFRGVTTNDLIALPVAFVVVILGGGPLAEEPGWRGFALPRMLKLYGSSRYAALKASLLLGIVWTFWHLPDFLTSAQHGGPQAGLRPFYANLPVFFLMVMLLTILFTWVYNRTQGSVFIAILLHGVLNTLGTNIIPLFPIPAVTGSELPVLVGLGTLVLLVLFLTRGQLGYQTKQE